MQQTNHFKAPSLTTCCNIIYTIFLTIPKPDISILNKCIKVYNQKCFDNKETGDEKP